MACPGLLLRPTDGDDVFGDRSNASTFIRQSILSDSGEFYVRSDEIIEPSGSPPGPAHASRRRHPSAAMESSRLLLARRYLQRGRSIASIPRGGVL